jgi:thioredoxin-dependent peroxiredoxin
MSKKRRKKSSKSSVGAPSRAASRTSANSRPSKSRGHAANNSGKNAKKRQTGSALPRESHNPPSKVLKSARAKKADLASEGASSSGSAGSALAAGAKAPAFRLPRDGGGTISLADYAGRKLVLFFFPRADTPGCTREAIDFTRLASAFAENQTTVVGVSADPLKAQEAFRSKHELSVPLASDEQHRMLEAYGAWGEKSMYGRTFQGVLRTTVLIGGDGKILKIWRNVKVDGHADDVLAAASLAKN